MSLCGNKGKKESTQSSPVFGGDIFGQESYNYISPGFNEFGGESDKNVTSCMKKYQLNSPEGIAILKNQERCKIIEVGNKVLFFCDDLFSELYGCCCEIKDKIVANVIKCLIEGNKAEKEALNKEHLQAIKAVKDEAKKRIKKNQANALKAIATKELELTINYATDRFNRKRRRISDDVEYAFNMMMKTCSEEEYNISDMASNLF